MFKPVVGLDIGSRTVKMVQLGRDSGEYYVASSAQNDIEPVNGGDQNGQKATISAIRKCLKSGNLSHKSHFVLGLSGPNVKISGFNLQGLTEDEIEQAVVYEAAQLTPFDITRNVVDYQIIDLEKSEEISGSKKTRMIPNVKGIVAVATDRIVTERYQLAKDASLKCVLMDSDGLAILNCLKETAVKSDDDLPAAVINIGRTVTTVTILGQDKMPFIRDINFSGNDIIENLANANDISVDQVEHDLLSGAVPDGLEKACKRLVSDISETLSYYSIKNNNGPVEHVYVCGGFSLVIPLDEILAGSVHCEVSMWNPFSEMLRSSKVNLELIEKCGPAFTVAAGLAMRQI